MKWDYANYALIIFVGAMMTVGVFSKLVFGIDVNSDWFWFLTGAGFTAEGIVSLRKQRKFDRKYKIIER